MMARSSSIDFISVWCVSFIVNSYHPPFQIYLISHLYQKLTSFTHNTIKSKYKNKTKQNKYNNKHVNESMRQTQQQQQQQQNQQ
jgi:hypothetical protein